MVGPDKHRRTRMLRNSGSNQGESKLPKVGLALGSGAARGLAHIGVLDVLEREQIPIDVIAGTSAGAMFGALYAMGKPTAEIRELALGMSLWRLAPLVDLPRFRPA